MDNTNFNWDAVPFFRELTHTNNLARQNKFTFCCVSGLEGFEEALHKLQNHTAFVCVSDIAKGYMSIDNAPHTRRVKTVFLAMRHKMDDMEARQNRFDTMRELFRQFMTVLIQEKTKLEQNCIYLESRIQFNEIERFFFAGCACAFFNITVTVQTDLRYDPAEWNIP